MRKKEAISLIVLVITIIVMAILATVIIVTLQNSGIIGKTRESVVKSDIRNMQDELTLMVSNVLLNGGNVAELNRDDASDLLETAKGYEGVFSINYGKLLVASKATEEQTKIAKELGIEVDDIAIYNNLKFNFVTTSWWQSLHKIDMKGNLTVTLPEESSYTWYYKLNEEDEFTTLTSDFSNSDWNYTMDYTTGEEVESKIYLGYSTDGGANINSKEFAFWQLTAPNAGVTLTEDGNIITNIGDLEIGENEILYIKVRYRDGESKVYRDEWDDELNLAIANQSTLDDARKNGNFSLGSNMGGIKALNTDEVRIYGVEVFIADKSFNSSDMSNTKPIGVFNMKATEKSNRQYIKWSGKRIYRVKYFSPKGEITSDLYEYYGYAILAELTYPENGNIWQNVMGWYYDKDYTQEVKFGEALTSDVNMYAKIIGVEANGRLFLASSTGESAVGVPWQVTASSATATGVISKLEVIGYNLKDFKIEASSWTVSEDGKKAYHPNYGTTNSDGEYYGGYVELLENSNGFTFTYNFDEEGKFCDASTGNGWLISGKYTEDDGTEKTYYFYIAVSNYLPSVKKLT